jgi:hypothetical protein
MSSAVFQEPTQEIVNSVNEPRTKRQKMSFNPSSAQDGTQQQQTKKLHIK